MSIHDRSLAAIIRQSALACSLSVASVSCGADVANDDAIDSDRDRLVAGEPQVTSTERNDVSDTVSTSEADPDVDRTDLSASNEADATSASPPGAAPSGLTVAHVSANGTGCPPGTWSVLPTTADTIDVRLTGHAASVTPSSSVAVKDCQLAIKIANTDGLSYAVKSVSYAGQASLLEHAQAQLTTSYYFQGDPTRRSDGSRSFGAPLSGEYLFQHDVAVADAAWSPCGVTRDLNLTTRVRLLNSGSSGSSTFDVMRVSGLQLHVRPCTADTGARTVTAPATGGPGIVSVTRR